MTDPIQISGDATINGVRTERVRKLIESYVTEGPPEREDLDTDQEWAIAKRVVRTVREMRRKGYSPKDTAAHAKRLVVRAAMEGK